MAGGLFSVDTGLAQMELRRNEEGALEIWREGCDTPHEIKGGKLGGLLAQGTEPGGIQSVREQVEVFTQALVGHLDAAHAMGVGIGGAMSAVTGGRQVNDPTAALSTQQTIMPTSAGSLFISINDSNLKPDIYIRSRI